MNTNLHPTPDTLTLLRFRDLVERRIVNNRMTLQRWIGAGQFPAPIRLGAGASGSIAWRAMDIQDWLDRRAAASHADDTA